MSKTIEQTISLSKAISGGPRYGQALDFEAITWNEKGIVTNVSALGAVILTTFDNVNEQNFDRDFDKRLEELRERFPILTKRISPWNKPAQTVEWWIETLSHFNGWTRNRIAKWVAELETAR